MIDSGAQVLAKEGIEFNVISAFEKTDVSSSLFFGALIGLAVALVLNLVQGVEKSMVVKGVVQGARSMLPAIYILLFAWTIAGADRKSVV